MKTKPLTIRAFIAIELPQNIKNELSQFAGKLKKDFPQSIRWVQPNNMHLTLRFLGDSSSTQIHQMHAHLIKIPANFSPMPISIEGIGVFPNHINPRIIWAGLKFPAPLINLQSQIEIAAQQTGYPIETKPFSPHLTLGRVSEKTSKPDLVKTSHLIQQNPIQKIADFQVEAFHLIRSDLRPGGPIYSILYSYPFEEHKNNIL